MKTRKRIALGLSSTALMLGAGAGIATGAASGGGHPGGGPPGSAAVAAYLGLTSDQIRADLQGGQTLAQIATAQGKTVTGLEDAIVAGARTQLDAAVTAGTLTSAQEATMLSDLQSHVADIVDSTGPPAGALGGPGGPGGGPASPAIAAYLGLTADALRTDLAAGKTLAQIATAQGKTVSGLEDAIVADAKAHLDAAVAAGKLTSAQEATMLTDLQSHVADAINSTGPPAAGKGGTFGPRVAGARLYAPLAR